MNAGDSPGEDQGLFPVGREGYGDAVLLIVFGLFVGVPVASATPSAADSSAGTQKYWLFLDARPGHEVSSSESRWTRPVARSYLRRLKERGFRPLVRSRWFHAVSAKLSPSERDSAAALPFVQSLRPVASSLPPAQSSDGDRASTLASLDVGNALLAAPLRPGASRGPLSRINALAPLRRGLDGHGVRVGFLDAHFGGLRHPAFSSLRADGHLAALRTFTEGHQSGNHGAGVVSVAAGYDPGSLIGPAHGATVLGATTEYTQFERNVEEDNFVAGLEWLHRRGADVVNVSIGYTRFDDGQDSYSPADLDGDTAITTRAVDRAAQLGVTVVVSAGNSGCADPDSCWFYVNTPADADSAIAVGAVLPDSSLAPFSSQGPTADGRRKPDVVVQGRDVVAAWEESQYAQVGGTSFASPLVAGVVAQMLQVNPTLSPMQVRRVLRHTASQADHPDTTRGWGIVDADAALRTAEWIARANPPAHLQISAPYRETEATMIFPVSAPSQTTSLQLSLFGPVGRRVLRTERSAHPGPNRLHLNVGDLPPGIYRYQLQTDAGRHQSGTVSLFP